MRARAMALVGIDGSVGISTGWAADTWCATQAGDQVHPHRLVD